MLLAVRPDDRGGGRAGSVLPRGKGWAAPEVGGGEAAISGRLSSPLLPI